MRVRPLEDSDVPYLQAVAAATGYEYPVLDSGRIEALLVVADDEDRPIVACAAERIVQLYLWPGNAAPAEKLHAIRLLHEAMGAALRAKGYNDANAFLPQQIERKFGRRLERSFGWRPNWKSWFLRF